MNRVIIPAALAAAALLSACSGGRGFPGDKEAAVQPEDQRWTVIDHKTNTEYRVPDQLLFATDSAEILPTGHQIVSALAVVAKNHGNGAIEVDGFTDTTGSQRHNDKLSIARAEAVAQELSQDGVDLSRIQTRGFGERELAVETPNNTSEAKNRRVVVRMANG
jgi:outer membrane protein OmpA-like peptidoglycan-associated protein